MDRALSSKRVSELIGLVYDCVIEPGRWQGTVHRLREELGFATCALSLHALPSGDPLLFISSGIEPDWLAKLLTLGESIVQIWGGAARIHELPLAEPIQLSHAVDPRSFAGNPFYDEWARPLGLTDDVGIHLMSDATAISSMGLGWHGARGELCEKHLAPLRLLAPHLRRAVTISRLMDLQLLAASTFARALDALPQAVLLVDGALGLVHANAAAEALLAAGDGVSARAGWLALAQPRSQAALADALARLGGVACGAGESLGQRGIGIPVQRKSGMPMVAHVLPLRTGELRSGVSQRAVAAVFIADAAQPPQMPQTALALLYDLTPAEARVFELVAGGATPAAIAARLGLAPSTVKTHLLRVFDKTGCRRQAELVRLAASLSV